MHDPWLKTVFTQFLKPRFLSCAAMVALVAVAHAPFASPRANIATKNFRLLNTANGPAAITLLSVGAGFTLSAKPALPLTLTAQGSTDFTVAFQGSSTGGYSAVLSTNGLSVLLIAAIVVDVRNSDRVGHAAARCIAC